MSLIQITDNSCGVHYSALAPFGHSENDLLNLKKIADVRINELSLDDNPNLLVFPKDLNCYGDKIGDSCIISERDGILSSGNIMGFVGVNDTQLKITSRFAKNDEEDYFLHYMLQKVFSINLFDIKHTQSKEAVFDFLLYLFPHFLKKALSQGLFKKYIKREHNDANVRGAINVSRHLRENVPFRGSVSYSTREHSFDNEVTQLIRHTIEYIRGKELGSAVLGSDSTTKECVSQIVMATPSYNRRTRDNVVSSNLKPLRHPYFSNYTALQRLCVQILRHESIKFGREKDKVYGVLFDGAWLWEEYLNTILQNSVVGLVHSRNKRRQGGIQIYKGSNYYFPDFYKKGETTDTSFVLDAKYKRLSSGLNSDELEENLKKGFSIQREDLFQMISYMHVLPAQTAALLYPIERVEAPVIKEDKKVLLGLGGEIFGIGMPIPKEADFTRFSKFMNEVEVHLKEVVDNL